MSGKRKRPTFEKRNEKDLAAIEKKEQNGGLSEETKKRRVGVNNVFDECQKVNDLPTLKERCDARDKDGLESDLCMFFQAYYVSVPADKVEVDKDVDTLEENDEKSNSGDEEEDINLDDVSDKLDEKNDDLDISDNEEAVEEELIKQRPKGNTALSYCSHLKQLILGFTGNEFDISNKLQFPKFYVSILNFIYCRLKKHRTSHFSLGFF